MQTPGEGKRRVTAALSEARAAAREELLAAWGEQLGKTLDSRFGELQTRFDEAVESELGGRISAEIEAAKPGIVEAAAPEIRGRARQEVAERFNTSVRRLLGYESETSWASALLDAAAPFADRTALFSVSGENLVPLPKRDELEEVPLEAAPAFRNAIESRDTVAALRTSGELSEKIAFLFDTPGQPRCYLVPVVVRDRAAAVLYAEGEGADVNALEAIAAVAGLARAAREPEVVTAAQQPEKLVTLTAAPRFAAPEPPAGDEQTHSRARQFARVRAAELMLYRNDAVRAGRASQDIYGELREEIDGVREVYAREFIPACGSMVDYFHHELLHTLARGDPKAMGEEYPGPLV